MNIDMLIQPPAWGGSIICAVDRSATFNNNNNNNIIISASSKPLSIKPKRR